MGDNPWKPLQDIPETSYGEARFIDLLVKAKRSGRLFRVPDCYVYGKEWWSKFYPYPLSDIDWEPVSWMSTPEIPNGKYEVKQNTPELKQEDHSCLDTQKKEKDMAYDPYDPNYKPTRSSKFTTTTDATDVTSRGTNWLKWVAIAIGVLVLLYIIFYFAVGHAVISSFFGH